MSEGWTMNACAALCAFTWRQQFDSRFWHPTLDLPLAYYHLILFLFIHFQLYLIYQLFPLIYHVNLAVPAEQLNTKCTTVYAP